MIKNTNKVKHIRTSLLIFSFDRIS